MGCHHIERWLGPAPVTLQETYDADATGPGVDHSLLTTVLGRYVTTDGLVRYEALRKDPADLDRYIQQLREVQFDPLQRNEKLALLINAYNAFTLRLILDQEPTVQSIKEIPKTDRWDAKRWHIGSLLLSLDQIEHEYLRPRFKEPRIHFAINCASISCPPLRQEAYEADRIEAQLEEQTRALHADPAWVRIDPSGQTLDLTRLYLWFEGDFEQGAGSVLNFIARYHPKLAAELQAGRTPSIHWLEYDWSLNQAR